MSVTLTMRPGTTVPALSFSHIQVNGAAANAADGSEKRYVLVASSNANAHEPLTSHVFNVDGGHHEWDNVCWPVAGAWTVDLIDTSDDSVAATLAVTVS